MSNAWNSGYRDYDDGLKPQTYYYKGSERSQYLSGYAAAKREADLNRHAEKQGFSSVPSEEKVNWWLAPFYLIVALFVLAPVPSLAIIGVLWFITSHWNGPPPQQTFHPPPIQAQTGGYPTPAISSPDYNAARSMAELEAEAKSAEPQFVGRWSSTSTDSRVRSISVARDENMSS